MSIKIVYFAHGSTEANEKELVDNIDYPLSTLGIEQATNQGNLVKNQDFDLVITSDFTRAVQTAEIMFGDRNILMIQDKRLREINVGIANKIDDELNLETPFEGGGESYLQVEKRIQDFLDDMKEKYDGKHIAIVTHRIPQLSFEKIINKKTWEQVLLEDWRKTKSWQPGWEYILD